MLINFLMGKSYKRFNNRNDFRHKNKTESVYLPYKNTNYNILLVQPDLVWQLRVDLYVKLKVIF